MKRKMSRRQFIASTTVAGGAAVLSKHLFAAPFQDPVLNTTIKDGKSVGHERVSWKVRPFPMKQVRLGEGPCKQAMEADRRYLHSLPARPPAAHLPHQCGIPLVGPAAGRMGGTGLRTARPLRRRALSFGCALMYASTGDEELKANANTVVPNWQSVRTR